MRKGEEGTTESSAESLERQVVEVKMDVRKVKKKKNLLSLLHHTPEGVGGDQAALFSPGSRQQGPPLD